MESHAPPVQGSIFQNRPGIQGHAGPDAADPTPDVDTLRPPKSIFTVLT